MRRSYQFVLKAVAALLPSVVMMLLLVRGFPHMGAGRMIALPIIVFMNLLLIGLALFVCSRLSVRYSILIWPFIIGITLCVTVLMYPQENNPSVAGELWDKLKGGGMHLCSRSGSVYEVYD
ncbi:hypothetical protein C2I18_05810 [Paenibacillus sp. PK3_47]|uniref:hypothetical protein n=1 Tax=Paenibacillus sp. PK3_47 TaxID=2072642 RepID=UPI00201E1252|nr:hypothetical protein [Paenibacillus sp. PK3_47]UQZ33115.1 hypothetical protein C2I18_05810 [Paenibacillus sp. PK3_47]